MVAFLSSSCVLCGSLTTQSVSLCLCCQLDLPIIENCCRSCGIPTAIDVSACGECLKKSPTVDYSLSIYHYNSPVDFLIAQLKFNQQLSYASILGYLMQKRLEKTINKSDYPDVILPIPLHEKRLVKRGFNQSLEISRSVSAGLGIPIDYMLARRLKPTRTQMGLLASERKRNIKGCFYVKGKPKYKHVVLLDDVVTTGSTSNELALALKESGVEKVGVWAIARVKGL